MLRIKLISRTFLIVGFLSLGSQALLAQITKKESKYWVPLLDTELSQWEVWTGVPEASVKNLPPSYKKDENGVNKDPIGLGDPMGIFKVVKNKDGDLVLHISGEVYAGLTSLKTYSNYHITLLFKWGEKKYEPRLARKRDNGLLYHCYGEHGVFWNVWKSSLEYQIQEGDFGDLYTLAGTKANITIDDDGKWNSKSKKINKTIHTIRKEDAESPNGEWSRLDLYVLEDSAVHLTNGKVVMALTDAKTKNGEKLDSGQLQLQSESAECYMKDIHIRPISKFPKSIKKAAGL